MRNPFKTPFAAVFTNEVLLNTKRVAPYAMMLLFSANAILWWGWGPAVGRGWATNCDFYIHRNLVGFSFILGLPIFNAVIMGDPVVRDLRLDVHPLLFSKPIGRGPYLLGKFFGSFFVLVCCQSAFAITLFLLQWVPFSGMVTLPVNVVTYVKHFFFVVVVSHLVLATFYFAVGTLSRNAKIVYGLAACFYPVYIAYLLTTKSLPWMVGVFTDPLGLASHQGPDFWRTNGDVVNQYVVSYSLAAYANRATMIVVSAVILFVIYLRFSATTRTKTSGEVTVLRLSSATEKIPYTSDNGLSGGFLNSANEATLAHDRVTIPKVSSTRGPAATLANTFAALGVEFRLLRAERSLIVIAPLAIVLSIFDLAFFRVVPEIGYSVTYASGTAKALLLFLVGMIVFYTGEAMHRDREVKIEPVVWSTPAPNSVLLLSKFFTTLVLALSLLAAVGLTAIAIQLVRGHTPVDFSAYLLVYGVVLVPGIIFVTALVVALNILLRNKYVAYVAAIGASAGLFYLYSTGHNHWLYNPLLYQLWTYPDLTSQTILVSRLYCLALAAALLALAHLFHERTR
ncbi:MAG TPA: hypothetical protein VN844_00220 [Pyrinomonadaceae bacterium]|nr:hypothetical protein [Pyrinomonadaceae bacterium]